MTQRKFAKDFREAKRLFKEKTGFDFGTNEGRNNTYGITIYDMNKRNRKLKLPPRKVNRFLVGTYFDWLEQ